MILVKSTVRPFNLWIICAVANVAEILNLDVLITSGNDSEHMASSKHYSYEAIDIRSKNLLNKKQFIELVQNRLGTKFQVIEETNHIHIEYDPK